MPGQKDQMPLGDDGDVEILELDRSDNVQRRWLQSPSGELTPILAEGQSPGVLFRSLREWREAFSNAFLPVGYPHSVSEDYIAYQTYDSLQAFFSTITGLLANRALLEGLGVGDADSSATFAMLLTIMKDAMSRVATIIFAQRFGLRIEPDAKRFRFLADLFNDTAFFLELYSPYLGPWGKVAALGLGEALRALCGVAAGASKAALSVHFAKHDNLAELNAKEASQETAVGLVGLLVGTLVVRYVQNHSIVVYLMTMLVFVHLWMNYLGVCSVCMTTFNRQRATIFYEEYLRSGRVLTPREVAAKENVLFWKPIINDTEGHPRATIRVAQTWPEVVRFGNKLQWVAKVTPAAGLHMSRPRASTSRCADLCIVLKSGATAQDVIWAWFTAIEAARSIPTLEGSEVPGSWSNLALQESMQEAGWKLETQGLETGAPLRVKMVPVEKKMQ